MTMTACAHRHIEYGNNNTGGCGGSNSHAERLMVRLWVVRQSYAKCRFESCQPLFN